MVGDEEGAHLKHVGQQEVPKLGELVPDGQGEGGGGEGGLLVHGDHVLALLGQFLGRQTQTEAPSVGVLGHADGPTVSYGDLGPGQEAGQLVHLLLFYNYIIYYYYIIIIVHLVLQVGPAHPGQTVQGRVDRSLQVELELLLRVSEGHVLDEVRLELDDGVVPGLVVITDAVQ